MHSDSLLFDSEFHRGIAGDTTSLLAELSYCKPTEGVDYQEELRRAEYKVRQIRCYLRTREMQSVLRGK